MGATSDTNAVRALEAWRGTEQLTVNSIGDTNYVIGYDTLGGVAVLEERESRQLRDALVVPDEAMDLMARWWLERRGWRVAAPDADVDAGVATGSITTTTSGGKTGGKTGDKHKGGE